MSCTDYYNMSLNFYIHVISVRTDMTLDHIHSLLVRHTVRNRIIYLVRSSVMYYRIVFRYSFSASFLYVRARTLGFFVLRSFYPIASVFLIRILIFIWVAGSHGFGYTKLHISAPLCWNVPWLASWLALHHASVELHTELHFSSSFDLCV